MPAHTRVVHSVTGLEWDAPTANLASVRERGWRPVDEPDDGPDQSTYDDLTVDQLKAEIDTRNADLPDDAQISKTGVKADLVDALTADDTRRNNNPA